MKRAYFFISILFAILMIFPAMQAQVDFNEPVSWIEGETWILYYGTFDTVGTTIYYSKALDIGEANDVPGSLRAWAVDETGTEDVNVWAMYTNDLDSTRLTVSTTDLLDQVTAVAKVDSLGDSDHYFYQHRWLVVKAVGQSGNPAASDLNWFVFVKKRAGAPQRCAGARSLKAVNSVY